MTILEHYNKYQTHNFTDYIGWKVHFVVGYSEDGAEIWSEEVKTITDYLEDVCGEGCCSGYILDDPNHIYRSGQLKLVD